MKIYKIIFSTIILFCVAIFSFYLHSIIWVLNLIASLWIYTIIFYLFSIAWRKLRKKELVPSGIFIQNFLYSVSWMILILSSLLFGTSYYFNSINPASMPLYTISNGEKIVKFQTMIHIAKPNFYEKVKENLINFKKEWAVYFFEWVKAWKKENHEKFNKALWIKFDENLYKNLSKLYWVSMQNNKEFLWLVNDKDFNIDISMDEIIAFYDKKDLWEKNLKAPLDANKEIIKVLSKLNEKELKILVYFNQAILNALIWNKYILAQMENASNKELFEVILWERNNILANEILNSPHKKIFITYWKLHFEGVFNILKQKDNNWKIIKEEKFYPIK